MAKSKGIQLGRSTTKGARNTSTQRLKRKAVDAFDDAPLDSFLLADEDGPAPAPQEEEEHEEEETAEQKRLRIDEAFEGVTGGEDDAVAQRLQQEAMDALGYNQRQLAGRVRLPPLTRAPADGLPVAPPQSAFRLLRGHWQTVTCCCITTDESTVFAVGKDGRILRWDLATGASTQLEMVAAPAAQDRAARTVADWAPKPARTVAAHALLACAVSSDGKFLAVGGADRKVHVFDVPTGAYLQGFKGHQDVVTCLAFCHGTHTLLSGSTDRQVKIWSLDDSMYIDTLFGHQAEVLCIDMLRAERAVTGGHDRTCRVWKIPEESQLVFRAPAMSIESVAYLNGGKWVSGGTDGALCLWSNQRKKPSVVVAHAHADLRDDKGHVLGAGAAGLHAAEALSFTPSAGCSDDSDACRWVTAVAAARNSDVVASAAGSGVVRFWAVEGAPGHRQLVPLGGVSVRGFVSALRFGDSGRVLVASLGQEPRMGRWGCDKLAANGVAVIDVPLAAEEDA